MEKILLDFSDCKHLREIHKVLKESFEFPDYYGENWSALWDCLDYWCNDPTRVEIYGLHTLPKEFDEGIKIMLRIFDDVHTNTPNVEFVVIS